MKLIIVTFLLALGLNAQTHSWSLNPQLISTSSKTNICNLTGGPPCSVDIWLCFADASTTASSTTITFADLQVTPVIRPTALAISANNWWVMPLSYYNRNGEAFCAWYPGGLTITIGNANVLTLYMSGKY